MLARPVLRHAHQRAAAAGLAGWLVLLALMLLAPSAEGPSSLVASVASAADALGVPSTLVAPERVEFACNVVAFAPVSLLGSLLWTRVRWRDWTAIGFVASMLVEITQAAVLDGRSATYSDVVANTLGALVGGLLAVAAQRLMRRGA